MPDETARAYGRIVRDISDAYRNPLLLNERDVIKYVQSKNSLAMKRRAVSALHSFYAFALDSNSIESDPSRRVSLRRISYVSNADLLVRLHYTNALTWGQLLNNLAKAEPGQFRVRDEILRRAVVRMRKCRTASDLAEAVRERIGDV
ncbi:MAG: hypothetical protein ACYDDQ_02050 [Vulcanimicrobiaceae bacterium]